MRILWFTSTPSNASFYFGCSSVGGGWISSLESLIEETKIFELGICFFYQGKTFTKLKKGNINYFGIPLKEGNFLKRILARHCNHLNDEDPLFFDDVINEFKPDLIHVFGTEFGYGKILMRRYNKVLFHLQGLVAPYADVYFPPGFNKCKILSKSNLIPILRGITFVHNYRLFRKRAHREEEIIKYWQYFSGRTEWDKNYIRLMNPNAHYFHCEELLRKEFFENEWIQPSKVDSKEKIVIGSTIRPNLYKGLDLIYNTMDLIKSNNIHWKIFGISENDTYNKIVKRVLRINNKYQNIEFYGQLSASELVKQFNTCHFFVHPSYIENSPNSVCEAMMLGIPVLSSSVGGTKSLITDNKTGFLFNPYDRYDLTGLLVNLINNYDIAIQAGLNARQVALKRHSPDGILSTLCNIYKIISKDDGQVTIT
jgi:glycosyltransferase involved in cell wall biosynthesis